VHVGIRLPEEPPMPRRQTADPPMELGARGPAALEAPTMDDANSAGPCAGGPSRQRTGPTMRALHCWRVYRHSAAATSARSKASVMSAPVLPESQSTNQSQPLP